MIAYARAVDTADPEAFAAVFAEDGELILPKAHRRGREQLRRAIEARDAALRSQHVITNMLVLVESTDRARGSCYLTLFRNQALGEDHGAVNTAPALVAIYEDEFERTSEGWRIRVRRLKIVFG